MSHLQVSTKATSDSPLIDSHFDQEYNSIKSSYQNQNQQHFHSKSFVIKKEPLGDYNYSNNNRLSSIKTNNNNYINNNQLSDNNNINFMPTSVSNETLARDSLTQSSNQQSEFVVGLEGVSGGLPLRPPLPLDNFLQSPGTSSLNIQENLETGNRQQQQQQNYLEENNSNLSPSIIKYNNRKGIKRPFQEDSNCIELKLQQQQQQQPQQQQHHHHQQQQHCSFIQSDQFNNQQLKQLSKNSITTNTKKQPTIMNSNEHQVVSINIELEQDDYDSDEETTFDYEPVLTKILNEKKLALSNSPEVLKLLSSFSKQQEQQSKNEEHNHQPQSSND